MGGKCILCGYNKCNDALEFHHIDPNVKETHWGSMRANIKSLKEIVREMKKCALVCSNCHKEIHSSRSETRLPDPCPTIDEEKLWAIHEGVHEDVPKDNCPFCGKLKPTWYMTCSLQCGYKMSSTRKIDWAKYDVLKMYETMSTSEIADYVGCSSGAVLKRIKKLDPMDTIRKQKGSMQKQKVNNTIENKRQINKQLRYIPDAEIIQKYNHLNNYEAVGREYNVTGAAVKRRLRKIFNQQNILIA